MKQVAGYISEYFYDTNKKVLLVITVFTAVLIFLNYYFGIDAAISKHNSFAAIFLYRYIIYLLAFSVPYLCYYLILHKKYIFKLHFLLLLFIAPAIFSFKAAFNLPLHFSPNYSWNKYWNYIFYWPFLLIITGSILFFIWRFFEKEQPLYGIKTKGINWKPYWIMILIMIPLIAAAATQPDFLAVYPKLKSIEGIYHEAGFSWWHKLLFELSYGTDFITIELFFRGFLILAFIKWAGKDAIFPMACFYCTIHFGKPLGECISSYFGGMILGVVVYHTRSILGGLIVHLGIAWLMEIGGYIALSLTKGI